MAKKNCKKLEWLRQLLACLLVLAMIPVSLPAYAAGGAGISTVVSGASSVGVSVDSEGNLYYMSSVNPMLNSRYINIMSPGGDITRMAGGGTLAGGGMADGVDADKAIICNPWKTVLYDGELYFSDTDSMRIRKISDGKVYNVVGDGASYSDPDGTLTALTRICNPRGMAFDKSGNLYFAEAGGYRIRVVSADRSTIGTVAGNGTRGFSGDGGPASAAEFEIPSGIAFDASENLYIADPGNQVIWEVAAEDHTQYGIDMQAGYIYIVAGGGDVSGEGIQANQARMYWPRDVIVDDSGNLYIAELHRVRKIDTDGMISTIAGQTDSGNSGDGGDASEALFNNPLGLALDSDGNLFVADTGNEKIRKITFNTPASDLAITTASLPDGAVGTAYSAQLAASGGTGDYTWNATGLPAGLAINSVTGAVYGMPTIAGTSSIHFTVTDSVDANNSKDLNLTIDAAAIPTHTVSISANPSAGGSVSGGGVYNEGASVTVTASVHSGYTFANWTEGGMRVSTNSAYTFTMGTADRNLTANFTLIHNSDGGHNSGGSGNSNPAPAPEPEPVARVLDSNGNISKTVTVKLDSSTGAAAVEVDAVSLSAAFDKSKINEKGIKTVKIDIPKIDGAKAYEPTLPASFLTSGDAAKTVEIKTETASVKVPGNMLSAANAAGARKVSLTIAEADKSKLDMALQTQIGGRPIIELNLKIDGKQAAWSNEKAPVAVSIPYTPTKEELKDPEHIVIWYIDGSGNIVSIPNGCYDPATETVTFTTTHFSRYAVSYKKVTFNDVAADAWYSQAVGFTAARDITTGTGNGNYSPDAKLTRGQFLVMLMRSYEIAPDANSSENFADAGNTFYTGYLAAAKRLGISIGVGGNLFAPEKEITRQEMFTLLYNALKSINKLPEGSAGKSLSAFSDSEQIESWAKDAMSLLVKTGAIGGNAGKLSPTSTTTRAEMAQVLYNLLSK